MKQPAGGGLRWPRALAHLAIIVVFVLAALGYVPLGEHAKEVAPVAVDATRATTACQPRGANAAKAGVREPAAQTLAHECDRVKAELAFARKHASGTPPDLPRALNARPTQ